jgi:putative redox protein
MQKLAVEAKRVLASSTRGPGATTCGIEAAQDRWIAQADTPDRAHATPHEILDAALAACTTLTLQLYVKDKGWPATRIRVAVTHRQDEDVYRLERRISVEGDLTAEQRAALMRVAHACPVHQTLAGDISFNTSLA